jgi:hypothetical protein
LDADSQLPEIVLTLRTAGGFPRRLNSRQQQRHQNSDNCNYHQELDQSKAVPLAVSTG